MPYRLSVGAGLFTNLFFGLVIKTHGRVPETSDFNPNYFLFLNMFMNCSSTSSKEVQEFGNIQIYIRNKDLNMFMNMFMNKLDNPLTVHELRPSRTFCRNFFFLISTTLTPRVP
jgi:hypothetical protein